MLNRTAPFALIAAAFLALLGTTTANAMPTDCRDGLDTPQAREATVVVRNTDNWLRVEVYAVTEAGRRFHLGVVNRASVRTFKLPDPLADGSTQFRLKVYSLRPPDPASALQVYLEGVKTRPLSMTEGETIMLTVASPLTRSFIDRG
jgi:hypothetical protein